MARAGTTPPDPMRLPVSFTSRVLDPTMDPSLSLRLRSHHRTPATDARQGELTQIYAEPPLDARRLQHQSHFFPLFILDGLSSRKRSKRSRLTTNPTSPPRICCTTPRTQLRQGFQAGRRLQELEAKMAEDKELADEYDRREAAGHAARYCKRIRV